MARKNLSHKQKVKMARNMRTTEELKAGVPLFVSNAWLKRKFQIQDRLSQKGNYGGAEIKKVKPKKTLWQYLKYLVQYVKNVVKSGRLSGV